MMLDMLSDRRFAGSHDQADRLRELVFRTASDPRPRDRARRILVASGRHGCGVTSVAAGLARCLARHGWHTRLVQASTGRSQPETAIGPDSEPAVMDAAGEHAPQAAIDVLDWGPGTDRTSAHRWETSDLVVLVTTPHPQALLDAYATIKAIREVAQLPEILSVVNHGDRTCPMSQTPHERLKATCSRFLQVLVTAGVTIPFDQHFSGRHPPQAPPVPPSGAAAIAMAELASRVAARLVEQRDAPAEAPAQYVCGVS